MRVPSPAASTIARHVRRDIRIRLTVAGFRASIERRAAQRKRALPDSANVFNDVIRRWQGDDGDQNNPAG
jgi:hypothetical protein